MRRGVKSLGQLGGAIRSIGGKPILQSSRPARTMVWRTDGVARGPGQNLIDRKRRHTSEAFRFKPFHTTFKIEVSDKSPSV
jgi:hypothetical protein